LLEVKKINSGIVFFLFEFQINSILLDKREKERIEREQRREDDIKRRNQAQIEENVQRMKVFEETAKSFGTKLETSIDKLKEQALKDKQAHIEKERKA